MHMENRLSIGRVCRQVTNSAIDDDRGRFYPEISQKSDTLSSRRRKYEKTLLVKISVKNNHACSSIFIAIKCQITVISRNCNCDHNSVIYLVEFSGRFIKNL